MILAERQKVVILGIGGGTAFAPFHQNLLRCTWFGFAPRSTADSSNNSSKIDQQSNATFVKKASTSHHRFYLFSSPEHVGKKIHKLLLHDATKQQSDNDPIDCSQHTEEECTKLLAGTLSKLDFIQDVEFFSRLARSLVTGNLEEERQLCGYLKEVTNIAKQYSNLTDWGRCLSFLLLVTWCLPCTTQNSQLESFLLHILLNMKHLLTQDQKKLLTPPIKQALQKLSLSPESQTPLVTSEGESDLVLLYLWTFDTSKIPKPDPLPRKLPSLAEDPFPSLLEAFHLAIALGDSFLNEEKKGDEERAKKKAQVVSYIDTLLQQFISRFRYLLSFVQILKSEQTFTEAFRTAYFPNTYKSQYQSIYLAYLEGVSLQRVTTHLLSFLSLASSQTNRAECVVASYSLPHILFLFRKPASPSPPFLPSTHRFPYILPFSLLVDLHSQLLSSLFGVSSEQIRKRLVAVSIGLASAGLHGLREVNRGRESEVKEEEKRIAVERGGHSLTLLLNQINTENVRNYSFSYRSFLLSLTLFLHLTHSLPLSSSLSPSLSLATQSCKEKVSKRHFDSTCPLLLPKEARLEIVSLLSSLFLSATPLSFLSSLLRGGGVVKRMGCVVDGRVEVKDEMRFEVTKVLSEIVEEGEKKREKIEGIVCDDERVDEKSKEEERREFVSVLEDALEEEGIEDSLLLLAGVEVDWRRQEELRSSAGVSVHVLFKMEIVAWNGVCGG